MNPTVIVSTIVMGAVALVVAAIMMFVQKKTQAGIDRVGQPAQAQDAGPPAAPAGGGDADPLIREASARLAQSKTGAGVANLPMIFVIGDKGTAKTSTILNSGLDAELLAGQVYQDNVVAPTRAANIFFARGTVFVEAGGALMANPQSWTALVKKLQPSRLKSMGSSGQAPRGVLLCFDLETFTRAGASEAIVNATRYLQARLGEISEILGISYPVYVLFTRADRIPFFAEFVRNLNPEEAGQVVGATVPIRTTTVGVYSEEETQRLTWAFNQLFHSFCDHRLLLLPREGDAMKLPQAYEFPREFRKLRASMVQFLVDVCRPSQLRAGPFLRGFYFSGVRPVAAAEAPVAPLIAPSTPAEQAEVGGATRMFRAGFQAEQKARQAVASASAVGKRVPQWLFLGHLFNDVVLADANARAASGSSTKTSFVKRVMLASSAALCLIYSGLLTWSCFENYALQRDVLSAANAIPAAEGANGGVPGIDSLQKLDQVRLALANLTKWRDSTPLGLGFGLYKGNEIRDDVRKIYYRKFWHLMFGSTQAKMLASLQRSPASPGPNDDYRVPYDTLKSYLLTTSDWSRTSDASLQTFLSSKLDARWVNQRETDIGKDRLELAKTQFAFYASDLHNGNPYSQAANEVAVTKSRNYLAGFPGLQRNYMAALSAADKQIPTVSFNVRFPGTEQVVSSKESVRGAFTKEGAKVVLDAINNLHFDDEAWVLGEGNKEKILDKPAMQRELRDQYTKEYIAQWRAVLKTSNVNRYNGLPDAASKLTTLSSPSAPLLRLFWWTSQNTCVDLPGMKEKFQAPQAVVPCSSTQFLIVDSNRSYNSSLQALQQAVDRAASDQSTNKEDALRGMHDSAGVAKLAAQSLGSSFMPDQEAQIDHRSLDLLLQPINYVDGIGGPSKPSGATFCAAFEKATRNKFPFEPLAREEAKLEDIDGLFLPKSGKLWVYYESSLKSVLQCTPGGECAPAGGTHLDPKFALSIGRLMKFSRALYGESGTEPNYHYTLRPQQSDQVEQFEIAINGDTQKLKGGAQHPYIWPGAGTRSFKLSLKLAGGTDTQVETWDGLWAVFHFFADADKTAPTGSAYTFGWGFRQGRGAQAVSVLGRQLTYEFAVDAGGGPIVFSKDFLSTLKCVVPPSR